MKTHNNIPNCPGIYRIYFKNKSYIGATFNLKLRLQKHFSYLKNNKHSNYHLQKFFNKNNNLKVEILKTFISTDREELLDFETYYHIKYNSVKNGFNIDMPRKIQSKFTLKSLQIKKASKSHSVEIMAFDRYNGKLLKIFSSITEAAKYFNGSTSNISQVCKGKLNYSYDCVFCYKKDYSKDKQYLFPNNHKKGKPHTSEHKLKLKLNHGKALKVYKYDINWNLIEEYISRSECERKNEFKKEGLRYKVDKETPINGYYYTSKIKDIV